MMPIWVHVCGCRPQPRLAAGHPTAGELPRGRQDQEPNPRQPVALARRAHRATPRRTARPAAAAVEIVRALPHGHVLAALGPAPHRALRRAAAPGAATPWAFSPRA